MKSDHSELVKEHFTNRYHKNWEYDDLIRKLIPKYEQMHDKIIKLIPFPKDKKINVLDLGIGSGQTALEILKIFSNSTIEGVDISEDMIKKGRRRLRNYLNRVMFYNKDMKKIKFENKYDLIVAVLSIHHLTYEEKQKFYRTLFNLLNKGGILIVGDIIKFDSEKETKEKEEEWKKFLIQELGEEEGNFWFDNYLEEDIPETIENQLIWLKEAGFKKVSQTWEYLNYGVFYAIKK